MCVEYYLSRPTDPMCRSFFPFISCHTARDCRIQANRSLSTSIAFWFLHQTWKSYVLCQCRLPASPVAALSLSLSFSFKLHLQLLSPPPLLPAS